MFGLMRCKNIVIFLDIIYLFLKNRFLLIFQYLKIWKYCIIWWKGVNLCNYLNKMKKYIIIVFVFGMVLMFCGEYNKVLKSMDYEYKYEVVKSYFGKGQNIKVVIILEELIIIMKGMDKVEELFYMLGMIYYNQGDFIIVLYYFIIYYNIYLCGVYMEQVRYFLGKVLFLDILEFCLDQLSIYKVIQELQMFMEYFFISSCWQDVQ